MSIKIKVPNKHFNGERCGIEFKNGEAIVEDEKHGEEVARILGYEIEKEKKSAPKKAATKKTTTKKSESKPKEK